MVGSNIIYLQGKGYTRYPALVAEPSFVVPANVWPDDFILKDGVLIT
jgi:hypothetical protein